jgi:RNA polymerase sigma-70 factor (ECF subfamily)
MPETLTKQPPRGRVRLSCPPCPKDSGRRPAIHEDIPTIQRVLAGDKNLFGDLVQRHQDRVYRVCLAVLRDPHEAEEASQDTFIRAYKALASFRGDSAFSTWLTRIAINTSRSRLRRLQIRRFFSLDALLEKGSFAEPAAPPSDPNAEAFALLASLPEADREVLLLKEVEGLDYKEISSVLGVSVEGVRGRLKRARMRLRHEKLSSKVS